MVPSVYNFIIIWIIMKQQNTTKKCKNIQWNYVDLTIYE